MHGRTALSLTLILAMLSCATDIPVVDPVVTEAGLLITSSSGYLDIREVLTVPSSDGMKALFSIPRLDAGGTELLLDPSTLPSNISSSVGLEVYSSYHDRELSETFLKVARDRKVLVTAGSDFHGAQRKPEVKLAGIPGNDYTLFERLKEAAGN